MKQVKILNANGYDALVDYPFPRVVPIINSESGRRSHSAGDGLVEVRLLAITTAAPEWTPPSWWDLIDTLHLSTGDWFTGADERSGWEPVDDNPFAFWNKLKESRDVGAAW
ncbi:MAG: hypothetical protein [Bacteriophage sp.]|nr:MAG: hypothetical protein [Bacteriophage sp.]